MSEFKINRNYENLLKTKSGKIKHTENIVDGNTKGLYIKCVLVEKNKDNKVSDLLKITIKENIEKKKFSIRIKTLKDEKSLDSLTKTQLIKNLSEKKYMKATSHSIEYIKKEMTSLRK